MSGASRGACRSGRLGESLHGTAMTTDQMMPTTRQIGSATTWLLCRLDGRRLKIHSPPNAPSMKMSPCAKLMSWDDAVDHGVTQRDQPVRSTQHDAVVQLLEELTHWIIDWATTNVPPSSG